MAYKVSPGQGVIFLSSVRDDSICVNHEEMLSANSRKCNHLPPVFEVKNTHHPSALLCILLYNALSHCTYSYPCVLFHVS